MKLEITNGPVNQTILVGMSYFSPEDKLIKQEQLFGKISKIEENWIQIAVDKATLSIPNDNIAYAPTGIYETCANHQLVLNPEFISSWCVKPSNMADNPYLWRPNYRVKRNQDTDVPPEWIFTYQFDEGRIARRNEQAINQFMGKTVLVGLDIYRKVKDGWEFAEQQQVYGKIVNISIKGVILEQLDGSSYTLPPDVGLLQPAMPGIYTIKATSKRITNPDYLTTWEVKRSE